jgi:hypothetical protein
MTSRRRPARRPRPRRRRPRRSSPRRSSCGPAQSGTIERQGGARGPLRRVWHVADRVGCDAHRGPRSWPRSCRPAGPTCRHYRRRVGNAVASPRADRPGRTRAGSGPVRRASREVIASLTPPSAALTPPGPSAYALRDDSAVTKRHWGSSAVIKRHWGPVRPLSRRGRGRRVLAPLVPSDRLSGRSAGCSCA